jgi:hypothetical protein
MQQKKAFAKGMQFGAFWVGPKEITSNKTTCSYIAEKTMFFEMFLVRKTRQLNRCKP